jgi:hypothetical protein
MKTAVSMLTLCCRLAVLLGLTVWMVGCASPGPDWAARVGHYTYDQAVLEMGPADKEAKLADGTVVADWLLYRGTTYIYGTGDPCWPSYAGPAVAQTTPSRFLRLTFGPNSQLTAWKKVYK